MKGKQLLTALTLGLALTLALLWILGLGFVPVARAVGPLYVAPGGNDGNACASPGATCATINGARAMDSSGDTLLVPTGIYTGADAEAVWLNEDANLSGGRQGTFTTQSGTSAIDGKGARQDITLEAPLFALPTKTVNNYCPPLYVDDFSNSGSGWIIANYTYSRYEYLNGEYRILRKAGGWAGARPWPGGSPGFKGENYIVVTDVWNTSGVYGSYGLLFGMSDDWTQFYTFEIFPDSTYEIWRGGYGATWTLLTSGSSGSINTGTVSNRLKIERNGSLIKAYANDQLLTSISDSLYTGLTQVGLIVSSYGSEVDARFDNFTVYPVTCDAATVFSEASETSDSGGGAMEVGPPSNRESGPNRNSK